MKTTNTFKAMLLMSLILGFTLHTNALTPEIFVPDATSPYYRIRFFSDNYILTYSGAGDTAKPWFNETPVTDNLRQWWKFVKIDDNGSPETDTYLIYSLYNPLQAINNKGACGVPSTGDLPYWVMRFFIDTDEESTTKDFCATLIVGSQANSFNMWRNGIVLSFGSNKANPPTTDYSFIFEPIDLDAELAAIVETVTPVLEYECDDESLIEALQSVIDEAGDTDEMTADEKVDLAQRLFQAAEDVKTDLDVYKIEAGETTLTIPVSEWGDINIAGIGAKQGPNPSYPNLGIFYGGNSSTAILHLGRIDFSTMGNALESIALGIAHGENKNMNGWALFIDDNTASKTENLIAAIPNMQTGSDWFTPQPSYATDLTTAQTITGKHNVYLKYGYPYTEGSNLLAAANVCWITFTVKEEEGPGTSLSNPSIDASISADNGVIRATFDGTATVKLYSAAGQLIDHATATGSYTKAVEKGIYIISLTGGENTETRKLILP
jgi:hypothetical protein